MTQVVENWSMVRGRLEAIYPMGKYVELETTLDAAAPVPGFPNLLAQFIGAQVRIRVAIAARLDAGQTFEIRARLAGPGVIWGDTASLRVIPLEGGNGR